MTSMRRFKKEQSSAITVAAVSAAVLAILIAGFLAYLSNEYRFNARSHRWTQALNLAEAGVEMGCAEFNFQYWNGALSQGFTAARGWQAQGGGSYTKTVTNYTDTAGNIVGDINITASGVGSATPQVFAIGTCAAPVAGTNLTRAVRVYLKRATSFPYAFMTKTNINYSGGVSVDSYDSSDPTKSTGGLYDPTKRQANGSVACIGNAGNGITVGNAAIYGNLSTGPVAPVSIGGSGSYGPTFVVANRCTTVACGLSNGYLRKDLSVDIPDVALPTELLTAPSLGTITGGTIFSGDYQATGMNPSSPITISGTVRIYLTGDATFTGAGASLVIPIGSRLEVYTTASNVRLGGGGVVNGSGLAINNQWYTLAGVTTDFRITGSASWSGTVYAPDSDLRIGGGSPLFYGALIARTITANGSVQFHYDEALGNVGQGYSVKSWQSFAKNGGSWVPE
jgi:hypothetical protein